MAMDFFPIHSMPPLPDIPEAHPTPSKVPAKDDLSTQSDPLPIDPAAHMEGVYLLRACRAIESEEAARRIGAGTDTL